MDNLGTNNHPILQVTLLVIASITGITGDLGQVDILLSIVLKAVSIISFLLVIIINFSKLINWMKTKKKNKND